MTTFGFTFYCWASSHLLAGVDPSTLVRSCLMEAAEVMKDVKVTVWEGQTEGKQRAIKAGRAFGCFGEAFPRLPTCFLLFTPFSCSSIHASLCTVQG